MLKCLTLNSSSAASPSLSDFHSYSLPSSQPQPQGDSTDNTPASSAHSSPAVNLARREYSLALQSNSYNEIWTTIREHHVDDHHHHQQQQEGQVLLLERVLQPNRECVEAALRHAKPNALTRLVSAYFDHSENTTHLYLLLHRCLFQARALYAPLHALLGLLPSDDSPSLSQSQCDRAFNVFLQFDTAENPFPSPDSQNFDHIHGCFSQLKQQLDHRLRNSRSAVRLFCRASAGSYVCSIAITAITVSVRTLAALVAGPSCAALPPPPPRLVHKEVAQMAQLDAAAKGTYVLNSDLHTIERLVARLHAAVDGDKLLVRLVLESGKDRHPIQEVLKQLRKNHQSFLHQLKDLEEYICLCFNTVNRARATLLRQTLLVDHRQRQRDEIAADSHQNFINSPG
ncbi:UPF0496 protein At3g19330 isoform X2 [Morus notabilis]|uniref:UPF0496 protein At3g19330 isoform X2 n=1 Tax=Morus notabilis TaxID=981085 RepID=UPI000CED0C92|nr:UPF0496 protein At3g19330 isoform X2 [Morus notabilis]